MRPSREGSSPAQAISVRTAASAASREGRSTLAAGAGARAAGFWVRASIRENSGRGGKGRVKPPGYIAIEGRDAKHAFRSRVPEPGKTGPLAPASWQPGDQLPISVFAMLDDIYNKRILEFASTIPRIRRLSAREASAPAHSRLCGSTVTVDLRWKAIWSPISPMT